MKNLVIYFREAITPKEEVLAAKKAGFEVSFSMLQVEKTVVARYSMLPYYKDYEKDFKLQNSQLLNSYHQHQYIASFDYYFDIAELTFKTWFTLAELPQEGPFVVKGATNSKKQDWKTMMFAQDKKRAIEIAVELQKDSLISSQQIIVRSFEKLEKIEEGLNGLPFSNEWRFFFYKGELIDYGFYWAISEKKGLMDQEGIDLAMKASELIKDQIDFYVIDIAKTIKGKWKVVECNDGQMSGLSDIDPESFYKKLYEILNK